MQVPWYGEDNRYYVDALRRYPGRFAALGYLPDPLAPDAPAKLRRQHAEDGFRGIRLHLLQRWIVAGVAAGAAGPLIREAVAARVGAAPGGALPGQDLHHRPPQASGA